MAVSWRSKASVSSVSERVGAECVPPKFQDVFLDTVDQSVGPAMVKAVAAARLVLEGKAWALFLSGRPGCGKSLVAAATANEWSDRQFEEFETARVELEAITNSRDADPAGRSRAELRFRNADRRLERDAPWWLAVPSVLHRLRSEIRQSERRTSEMVDAAVASRGLVVLDDVGVERGSDFVIETLGVIVGERYDAQRPTLITSNFRAAELAKVGHDRVISRLADHGVVLDLASLGDFRQRLRVVA